MFTCGLSDLLLLVVGSLVVFVLREYILKVHIHVSSEHKLCQIWNTCTVSCIVLFKPLLFEQWSIFKILQFILLFLNICFRLKHVFYLFLVFRTIAGLFKVYFDFNNFHLTTRLRWPYYYTLYLLYLTLTRVCIHCLGPTLICRNP
jgi:hypothetical protein